MSIRDEIDRITENVENTYTVLEGAGASMPQTLNTDNLPRTAASIKAVLYSNQSLTEAQKTQARKNIGAASDAIPHYVAEEAKRVANLVMGVANEHSLIIAACSDMHHYYDTSKEAENAQAIQHTAIGIGEIAKYVPIDLYINHGDYRADNLTTVAEIGFIRYCLSYIYGLSDMEEIWCEGNHDIYNPDAVEIHQQMLLSERNKHNVTDMEGKTRNYGYKDFDDCKIRVIYFNTTDYVGVTNTRTEHMVSPEQCQWLIDQALDFSTKENASEWGIVLVSHIPLDWGYHIGKIMNIIDAYLDGGSGTLSIGNTGSTVDVTYNFSTLEKADVLCAIHGHTHNYINRAIGNHNIPSLSTPPVTVEKLNNYYESNPTYGEFDNDGHPVFHYKNPDSAQSTSFVVYVVDRDTEMVHAFHYGAGIDRVASWASAIINQIPISTDANGAVYNTAGYKENTRLSSSGGFTESAYTGVDLTGYIPVKNGDVVRLANMSLAYNSDTYPGMLYLYNDMSTFAGHTTTRKMENAGGWNIQTDGNGNVTEFTMNFTSNVTHMRLTAADINAESIITVNQVIE